MTMLNEALSSWLETKQQCRHSGVTYEHRVQDVEKYNWCVVPDSGSDAVLFISTALLASCICSGQLSALYILLLGGLCQGIAFPVNLGRFGNSFALFLGVQPAEIFLYVFLPPILFDAAVRIDYYVFKKMLVPVISLAFLIVIASTAIYTPLLLYLFDLRKVGWLWEHGALFSAMISSTDAVAVAAILKKAGAPERLCVLMEGESLFNDSSSIVLFKIFFDMVKRLAEGKSGSKLGMGAEALSIATNIVWLTVGGALIGFACAIGTRLVLKWMHRRGHKAPEQLALTVAMAYLSFYIANGPCEVSGVIAVVVMGLYGAATNKWHMSPRVVENGTFDAFWDTISFGFNGLVFFFAGASATNFAWRSTQELYEDDGNIEALFTTFWRLPLLYLTLMAVRFVCIALFNPLFQLTNAAMTWNEITFTTFGGLRGAVSLILAQVVVTEQAPHSDLQNRKVTAQIVLWTSGIVVLSLLINAPFIPLLLKWTGLCDISAIKIRMRGKAARALLRYTKTATQDLQHDEDEMLRGVDWGAVESFVDLKEHLNEFAQIGKDEGEGKGNSDQKQRASLEQTRDWIKDAAMIVGHSMKSGIGRGPPQDEERPLLPEQADNSPVSMLRLSTLEESRGLDAAKGALLELRQRLSTLEENEEEDVEARTADQGGGQSMDHQQANQCAAELLRSASLIPEGALDEGPRDSKGKVIGAAEGNKEMADRHQGFGAYDVPFLGPMRTGIRGRQDDAADEEAAHAEDPGGQSEDEPEVLDLENPNFHIRPHDDMPAGPVPQDQIDRLEFAADERRQPAQHDWHASQEREARASPFSALNIPHPQLDPIRSPNGTQRLSSEYVDANQRNVKASAQDAGAEADKPQSGAKFTVVAQPIIVPRMIKPRDVRDDHAEQPSMRWISTTPQGDSQSSEPRGRTVLRANPNEAMGFSYSVTDTSVPSADGNRRTVQSRHRRAKARVLHSAMSGPLHHASSDGEKDDEDGEEEDELDDADPEVLAEARVRLVAGLKRYFHDKRGQGLLSGRGMLVLDHACDVAMDGSSSPLVMWSSLEREMCGKLSVRCMSRLLFWLRRFRLAAQGWHPQRLVRFFLIAPSITLAEIIASELSRVMLIAIEVAVEYWLALTWSPQAQWLSEVTKSGVIQDEVKSESKKVWKFIIEREIEAPARFQAIQTHRAVMAILQQQGRFVEQLYGSGMVDEAEKEALHAPIERLERRLMRRGALGWRSPRVDEVLRNLPFLKELPDPVFEALLASGNLVRYGKGDSIWSPLRPAHITARGGHLKAEGGMACEGNGIFVVMAGLVKSSYSTAEGRTVEYFLGSGGVFGLLTALVGEALPGSGPCIAVGNALMQGPVIYHMPQSLVNAIKERAEQGDAYMKQLELDLYRVAALYLVERIKNEVVSIAATHFQALAVGQARQRAIRRLAHNPPGFSKSISKEEVWSKVGHTDKAQQVLSSELLRALDSPLATHLNDNGDNDDNDGKTQSAQALKERHSLQADLTGLRGNRPGPSDLEVISTLEPRRMWKRIRKHAAQALGELRIGLRDAELVQLKPGEQLLQQSSWVLLKGTVKTTGLAAKVPAGMPVLRTARTMDKPIVDSTTSSMSAPMVSAFGQGSKGDSKKNGDLEVAVQYSGPAVLPWLWQPVQSDGEIVLLPQAIPHIAGTSGALLLVCRPAGAEDTSDTQSNASGSTQMPDSPKSGIGASISSPQQKHKEAFERKDRTPARMAPMKSLPGEGTGEASENIGHIQANTNASRRLRVLSVRHLP